MHFIDKMSIVTKVRQVQKVFEQLEAETDFVRKCTGISCLPGCGQCCTKPAIEASVLEFLPFAFELFLNRQSTSFRERLEQSEDDICLLFSGLSTISNVNYTTGHCSQYALRGLICRLFGYATSRDKFGQRRFSTCKPIKEKFPGQVENLEQFLPLEKIPGYTNYYQQLIRIDFRLGQEFNNINTSILRAIQEVEHYYQYRPFPYRYRRSA